MVGLKHSESRKIDLMFEMEGGFVLDFTNKTIAEFFDDEFQIDIYDEEYSFRGHSKANRIRAFLELASPPDACKLLEALWNHKNRERFKDVERSNQLIAAGMMEVEALEFAEMQYGELDVEFQCLVSDIRNKSHNEITNSATTLAKHFDFDTVAREIDRARNFVENDPEDAITASCALVESVCRSILVELGLPLPKDLSVKPVYRAVRNAIGLDPRKPIDDVQVEADVRSILSGISSAIEGIGALRTHGGDAHGRERGRRRVDARIARLAVNSSAAFAIFLIETWISEYPNRKLPNADVTQSSNC